MQSLVLQERLSGFTDAVEVHLQAEISDRSIRFFEALGVLADLTGRMAAARSHCASLRATMRRLDANVLGAAATLASLQRRRRHAKAALALVHHVEAAATALTDAHLLLDAGDVISALDVLDDTQRVLSLPDVSRLGVARHMTARLGALCDTADALLRAQLVRSIRPQRLRAGAMPAAVAQAIGRAAAAAGAAAAAARAADDGDDVTAMPDAPAEAAPLGDMGDDMPMASYEGYVYFPGDGDAVDDAALPAVALPLVAGLLRLGRLSAALHAHREALVMDVRSAVKEVLTATLAASATAAASHTGRTSPPLPQLSEAASDRSFGERLRALPVMAYVALLDAVSAALLAILNRAQLVHATLVSAVDPHTGRGATLVRDSSDAVGAAADAAVQRWVKLLMVRGPVHATCLRVSDFALIVTASTAFGDALDGACAALHRRPVAGPLRATVASQAKALLAATHASSMAKLQAALDAEAWTRCDVPHEFQALADSLAAAGIGLAMSPESQASGQAPTPSICVDGKQYVCVAAALMLLRCLARYVDVATSLPSVATEVLHRTCEALQLFNGRSCQLVLGAGALRTAGLKSITAKTMATASQSLALVAALVPHVRAILALRLPPARHALLLTALDRAASDVQLHRSELHAKLVAIAGDRLAAHARQLPNEAERWAEEASPEDGDAFDAMSPSDLALSIHKELSTLRRVLVPLLQPEEATRLFSHVAHVFDRTLAEGLTRVASAGGAAPAHVCADATVLASALAALPGDKDPGAAAPALSACVEAIRRESAALLATTRRVAKATPPPAPPTEAPGLPSIESTGSFGELVAASSEAVSDEPGGGVTAEAGGDGDAALPPSDEAAQVPSETGAGAAGPGSQSIEHPNPAAEEASREV